MPKFWLPTEEQNLLRKMDEDKWFRVHQKMLVGMANTNYGKDLLCIDRDIHFPIIGIRKNEVRYLVKVNGDMATCISDFRIGAKWANVIRSRWEQFNSYARYFQANQGLDTRYISPLTLSRRAVFASTLTAYPDPNAETTTVDGYCNPDIPNATWTDLRGQASAPNDFSDSSTGIFSGCYAGTSSNRFNGNYRAFTLFDTSSLTSAVTVSAATLSLYGNGTSTNGLSSNLTVEIGLCSPASNTAIVAADYATANFTMTRQATGVTQASWNTAAYNDCALDATGISNISKTGVSKFAVLNNYDIDNSAPTWTASAAEYCNWKSADTAGTTTDPKLVVTYSTPSSSLALLGIG